MNKLLYIGLNGFAGSGKDTVAKMLYCILNKEWNSKEECYNFFKSNLSTIVQPYATFNIEKNMENNKCTCIAFADRLKEICSAIFGIPLKYFYTNKANSWICINKNFEYTENTPDQSKIITAYDMYSCLDTYMNSNDKYYMSLREILVYVGTYVCQYHINNLIFINGIENKIFSSLNEFKYRNLEYIICTDVRFMHEYEYIRDKCGIMINITRDNISQQEDIAEHGLDMLDEESYDFIISNNGTYDDLFNSVWSMVHDNIEFKNQIIELQSRDFMHQINDTYLRKVDDDLYKLCLNGNKLNRITYYDGYINMIDPIGGPELRIGHQINNITIQNIIYDDNKSMYFLNLK